MRLTEKKKRSYVRQILYQTQTPHCPQPTIHHTLYSICPTLTYSHHPLYILHPQSTPHYLLQTTYAKFSLPTTYPTLPSTKHLSYITLFTSSISYLPPPTTYPALYVTHYLPTLPARQLPQPSIDNFLNRHSHAIFLPGLSRSSTHIMFPQHLPYHLQPE